MAIDSHKTSSNPGAHIAFKHKARHDLESLVWVLGYIQLKRMFYIATATAKQTEHYDRRPMEFLDSTFKSAFGRSKASDILFQRELVSPLVWIEERSWNPLVESCLSSKLGDIIDTIFRKLRRIFYRKKGKNIYQLEYLKRADPDKRRYHRKGAELNHEYLIELFHQIVKDH